MDSDLQPDPPQTAEPDADPGALYEELSSAINSLRQSLEAGTFEISDPVVGRSSSYQQKLAILQAMMEMQDPMLEPALDPHAPRGHSFGAIAQGFSLPAGRALEMLEDLADLGLLQRELFNRVHLCPRCECCQINFRETCPLCSTIEVEIEPLIHHFHCGYVGLESEFTHGLDLNCPKCRRRLNQLGQDFERPHDTYVCRVAGHLFEDPFIECQCLACGALFAGTDIEPTSVYSYRPTELTMRAVELRRLTGLDVSQILYNQNLGLATRDFLALEIQRELLRMKRYGGAFTTAVLTMELFGKPYRILREWPATMIRELGNVLVSSVRALDLVAILGSTAIGIFLVEADEDGGAVVGDRILAALAESVPTTPSGQALAPRWRQATWTHEATLESIMAFYDEGVNE